MGRCGEFFLQTQEGEFLDASHFLAPKLGIGRSERWVLGVGKDIGEFRFAKLGSKPLGLRERG